MIEVCGVCRQPLKVGAKFCGKCGNAVSVTPTSGFPKHGQEFEQQIPPVPATSPAVTTRKRGGGVVAITLLLIITVLGGGVTLLRYSQEHSPSGRTSRLQIAAAKGDFFEVGRVMEEAREAQQKLDMTDALYFALMNSQPQMAQHLKDMGGDEAEARRRLEPLEGAGLEPVWKKIRLKGNQ